MGTKALLKQPLSITKTNRLVKPPSRLIQDIEEDLTDSNSDSETEETPKKRKKRAPKMPKENDPLAISGNFQANLATSEANLEQFSDPEDAPLVKRPKLVKPKIELDRVVKVPKLISN